MHDPKGDGKDIYNADFSEYLPEILRSDPKMKAFADAVTIQLLDVSRHINDVLIYNRLDTLPEPLIDILAYDMHVDWYDYSFPLEIKRRILKNSVKVHKKTGTKYAVETVLKSIHKGARVEEWFEYGGSPYFFRVDIDVGNIGLSEKNIHEMMSELQAYKNIRSHCETIKYNLHAEKTDMKAGTFSKFGEKMKIKAALTESIRSGPRESVKVYQRSSQNITIKKRG